MSASQVLGSARVFKCCAWLCPASGASLLSTGCSALLPALLLIAPGSLAATVRCAGPCQVDPLPASSATLPALPVSQAALATDVMVAAVPGEEPKHEVMGFTLLPGLSLEGPVWAASPVLPEKCPTGKPDSQGAVGSPAGPAPPGRGEVAGSAGG